MLDGDSELTVKGSDGVVSELSQIIKSLRRK